MNTTAFLQDFFVPEGVDALTEAFKPSPRRPQQGRFTGAGSAVLYTAPISEWAPEVFQVRADNPLSLYVHVPFCRHCCLFCPFYQNPNHEGFSVSYRDLLLREIDLLAQALGTVRYGRSVDAVFFGGGTPSDMAAADLAAVLLALHSQFTLTEDTEITVEGRIRDFTQFKAQAWVSAGVNRFSLGLQSTDSQLRKRLGRLADRDEIKRTLSYLKATGALVIVDLMFGLPGQTQASLCEDIRFLAEETPVDGLDLYELIQFPHSPLAQAVEAGRLVAPAERTERARMFGAASHVLGEYGFEHFTPQHWRRNSHERSLYNRLAKSDADMLPFGVSAGGSLGDYSLQHERELARYEAILAEGKLPLRVAHNQVGPMATFPLHIQAALERCCVPALSVWPENTRVCVGQLLANWHQGGLLETPPSLDQESRLTLAGCYWAKHLNTGLIACIGGFYSS